MKKMILSESSLFALFKGVVLRRSVKQKWFTVSQVCRPRPAILHSGGRGRRFWNARDMESWSSWPGLCEIL